MKTRACRRRFWLFPILLGVLTVGGWLVAAQPASAGEIGPGAQYCAQPRFNASNGANRHGKLNCTANDVAISVAHDPSPTTCTQGTTIPVLTFEADVILNANSARNDLGWYFNTGTDKTNGARGGGSEVCQILTFDTPNPPGDGVDLDGDSCGDIDGAHSPIQDSIITLTSVACNGIQDPNGPPGQLVLLLPYCSSWFIPGADQTCNGPLDAWPANGAKCKCDDLFTIPVIVQTPEGTVSKKATKAVVTYEVKVHNSSGSVTVRVKNLDDSNYFDITTIGHDGIVATDCKDNLDAATEMAPGADYTCHFDVQVDYPGASAAVSNVVTAVLKATTAPFNETTVGSLQVNVVVDLNAPAP